MEYLPEDLRQMYCDLVRGRVFTLKMHDAVGSGKIRSSFHTPYGQEAGSVALLSAMRKTDWLAPSHRMQAATIMRFDMYQYICELISRRDGYKKGTVFDYHGCDFKEGRILIPSGILGSIASTYTGFAWSRKAQGHDDVIVIGIGDGAASEGTVFEAYNIATLYKAPVLYVIENNGWAMTVPLERQSVNPNLSDRAKAFDMPAAIVDGDDILKCREVFDEALKIARGGQPNVVEIKCTRWDAHFVGQGDDYRNDRELVKEHMQKRDCVKLYEDFLLEKGVITEQFAKDLKEETVAHIDGLVEKADQSPLSEKDDVFRKDYIYANPETGGDM
jgi:TPP-dependent pyruvate/acetoin dehydrogenase alpha subunit